MISLRSQFGIPENGVRFRVICADGADFIDRKADSFDILLVDGFNSDGQPARLCSTAFYDNCHRALRPGGVLVVNLCADDSACGTYANRINDSFAGRTIVVDADEGENKVVFAGKSTAFPPTFNVLAERLRTLEHDHPVELDRTAQKILRYGAAHGSARKAHRK